MERAIEAAKTVHQLVVGAAVALLFFVAAPDRLDTSRKAAADLRSVVDFDRRTYFQFLSVQAAHLIEGTQKSLEPLGPSGVLPPVIVAALRCDIPDDKATLREWTAFANRRRQTIQTFILAPQAVARAIAGLQLQRGQEQRVVERAWIGDSRDLTEHEQFMRQGSQRECLPLRLEPAGQFSLMVIERNGEQRITTNMPLQADERSLEGSYFVAWAESRGWPVEQSPDGQRRLLTNAGRIADLSDKTPAQALVMIEDRIASSKGQVSFLGFSLGVDHLAIAGPIGLLLLLLYLLVHLQHALGLTAPSAQEPIPWIALFADPLSRALTGLSTVVLPVVAVLGLSARLAPTTGVGWALQVAVAGVVGGATLLVLRAMNTLRARCSGQPLSEGPRVAPAGSTPATPNEVKVVTVGDPLTSVAAEPSSPHKSTTEPP